MAITDLLKALKGERLSSVFSPDGTLISASAAPHCGAIVHNDEVQVQDSKKQNPPKNE